MKTQKILRIAAGTFIILSAFSFLSVSLMAFGNPQSVMDLVQVKLENNDAFSSIRGVYGGVGLAIFISLIYLLVKSPRTALMFLMLIWGLYAVSRIITILAEGALGAFGTQWLTIEVLFFTIATTLFFAGKKAYITKTI